MSDISIQNPTQSIQIEVNDSILTLTMNRDGKKNALTLDMYTALGQALEAASEAKHIRVVILAGAASYFTAGNDISDFLNNPPKDESSPVLQFLKILSKFEKPLIAAANGVAVGVGTTLLLHCDYVFLNENAMLKLPFVELGLCPEAASSLLLPRHIGYLRASEMILTGAKISAKQALQWGLANEVVDDTLLQATKLATTMAKRPPAAMALSKRLLKHELQPLMEERLTLEGKEFVQRLQSPEAREAFMAFIQKREPDFSSF